MRVIFFILLFSMTNSFAQESTIEGYVKLKDEPQNLEGAKVIIQDHNNHQNKSYGISDEDGYFTITHSTEDDSLDIIISYIHCIAHFQTIIVKQPKIELEKIVLRPDEKLLNAIIVISKPNPITIKNDTVIYNVSSFETSENATVEQLLEVLPGVIVDSEGNITANGKKVDKILVDGKPFFGNDLTIATRNLPKNMLSTVEISNSKSKSEAFTQAEGSFDKKTINLILKPDKKKGLFGEITGGLGFENKYNTNGFLNRFSGNQRISIIGSANNINAPRFSGNNSSQNQDLLQNLESNGITTSKNIGVNFSDELSEKMNITGSYSLMESESENNTTNSRETNLFESSFFTVGHSESTNASLNHNLNLGVDFRVNSNLLINISPSFTFTKNDAVFFQTQEQLNTDLVSTNYQEQNLNTNQRNNQFTNNFTLTQKIGENGGAFQFNFTNQNSQSFRKSTNNSLTLITADPAANGARNQLINSAQKKSSYAANASYKIPIRSKSVFLTLGAVYNYSDLHIEQSVENSLDTEEPITDLDLKMNNVHLNFLPSIALSAKKNKWRGSLKTTYLSQSRELIDHAEGNNNNTRIFKGMEITSNMNYQINNGLSLNGAYQLQNRAPTLSQVQTFPNVINPLNVVLGNPDLKSAYNHQIKFGLNSSNFRKNTTFFFSSSLDLRKDQIIRKLDIDENFFQTTTFVNANSGYHLSTSINYQKRMTLDSLNKMDVEISTNSSLSNTLSLNYGLNTVATAISLMPKIKAGFSHAEWLKLDVFYRLSFVQSSFDDTSIESWSAVQHSAGIATNIKFKRRFNWNNSFACNYNPSISSSFQKFNSIWNTGVSFSFKNEKVNISFKVFDVLNQNVSNTIRITDSYIEESKSLVLSRYAMLSLSWKFSKM